jgi:hypothetical protein
VLVTGARTHSGLYDEGINGAEMNGMFGPHAAVNLQDTQGAENVYVYLPEDMFESGSLVQ